MEVSWESLGARVRQARYARQLDQSRLAHLVGMERSGLAKVESGTRRVTAMELMALGEALSVSMTYFVTEPPVAMVSRRSPLEARATDPERARFETDLALEQHLANVQQIEQLGLLPAPRVGVSTAASRDPASLARDVRRQLALGGQPLPAMTDVAAWCGLWVLVVEGAGEGASITPDQGFGVAVVGAEAEPGRRRFTVAHELGHHLLGDEYSSDVGVAASRDERERGIDVFAQELLLPAQVVQAALAGVQTDGARDVLIELTARYRVSWTMACRVARQFASDAASRWDRPLRADLIRVTGSTVQPDLEMGQTASAWQQAVLAAHADSLITGTRAVELLHGALALGDLPEPAVTASP